MINFQLYLSDNLKTGKGIKILDGLILLASVASAVSVALLVLTAVQVPDISVGNVVSQADNTGLGLSVPITITSHGPLGISDIVVTWELIDNDGNTLVEGFAGPVSASPGSIATLTIDALLDPAKVNTTQIKDLATTSENLTMKANFNATIFPFAKIRASTSGDFYWGAPLANLRLGQPAINEFDSGEIFLKVPVSFENQSPFLSISGLANLTLLDSNGSEIGSGNIDIRAPHNAHFSGDILFGIRIPADQMKSLVFNDSSLAFTAVWQFPFVGWMNITEHLVLDWKAPIKNITFDQVTVYPINQTYSKIGIAFSFFDGSEFIPVNGSISGTIFDKNGSVLGFIEPYPFYAQPSSSYSGNLSGYIRNDMMGNSIYANLTFSTAFGDFYKEVSLNS